MDPTWMTYSGQVHQPSGIHVPKRSSVLRPPVMNTHLSPSPVSTSPNEPTIPYAIDQLFYLKKLEELDPSSSFNDFRSMRMRLAWLANTRPDLQFEISQIAQITGQRFSENAPAHVQRLNAAIRYATNNIACIKFPQLDPSSVKLIGYSDAAFANNFDLSSQLGYIILLTDKNNAAIPISFKSYKSKRVTRSVLSAEVIAFADLFDQAFTLRSQLEHALNSPSSITPNDGLQISVRHN